MWMYGQRESYEVSNHFYILEFPIPVVHIIYLDLFERKISKANYINNITWCPFHPFQFHHNSFNLHFSK